MHARPHAKAGIFKFKGVATVDEEVAVRGRTDVHHAQIA
jgi:hypothetical protein